MNTYQRHICFLFFKNICTYVRISFTLTKYCVDRWHKKMTTKSILIPLGKTKCGKSKGVWIVSEGTWVVYKWCVCVTHRSSVRCCPPSTVAHSAWTTERSLSERSPQSHCHGSHSYNTESQQDIISWSLMITCNSFASIPLFAPTWARTRDHLHTSTTASHESSLPILLHKSRGPCRARETTTSRSQSKWRHWLKRY